MTSPGLTIAERFALYAVNMGDECWPWTGAHSSGYGRMTTYTRCMEYAHRVSYKLHRGPIPEGMEIHHICGNRGCVNPEHLMATTRNDHPDSMPSVRRNQTHCKRGHEFTEENTYRDKHGRRCRTCRRELR